MTINYYLESAENYEARMNYAQKLGVRPILLSQVMKYASGRQKGKYVSEESRSKEKIAKKILRNPDSEIEKILFNYEIMLSRVEKKDITLREINSKERPCKICCQSNKGAYETCPVCLDVYHSKFRDNFLRQLNSCDALRILDGVR